MTVRNDLRTVGSDEGNRDLRGSHRWGMKIQRFLQWYGAAQGRIDLAGSLDLVAELNDFFRPGGQQGARLLAPFIQILLARPSTQADLADLLKHLLEI